MAQHSFNTPSTVFWNFKHVWKACGEIASISCWSTEDTCTYHCVRSLMPASPKSTLRLPAKESKFWDFVIKPQVVIASCNIFVGLFRTTSAEAAMFLADSEFKSDIWPLSQLNPKVFTFSVSRQVASLQAFSKSRSDSSHASCSRLMHSKSEQQGPPSWSIDWIFASSDSYHRADVATMSFSLQAAENETTRSMNFCNPSTGILPKSKSTSSSISPGEGHTDQRWQRSLNGKSKPAKHDKSNTPAKHWEPPSTQTHVTSKVTYHMIWFDHNVNANVNINVYFTVADTAGSVCRLVTSDYRD